MAYFDISKLMIYVIKQNSSLPSGLVRKCTHYSMEAMIQPKFMSFVLTMLLDSLMQIIINEEGAI